MVKKRTDEGFFDRWIGWLVAALAFSIPLYKRITPLIIATLLLSLMVQCVVERRLPRVNIGFTLWSSVALYAFLLFGTLYTLPGVSVNQELTTKLSLLVFPLLAVFSNKSTPSLVQKAEHFFVYGALSFIPLALSVGVYHVWLTGDYSYLGYEKLSLYFHPTYAATYQCLALFFLMSDEAKGIWLFSRAWLHRAAMAAIVLFVVLLASKAGFIAMLMVMLYHTYREWVRKASITQKLINPLWRLALFVLLMWKVPVAQERISAVATAQTDASAPTAELPGEHSSTGLRRVIWGSALDLSLTHPTGFGTGNVETALVAEYESRGEAYAAFRKLNAHNQWLQLALEVGWFPAFLFAVIILAGWIVSFLRRHPEWWMFTALLGMNCLFESFLEVQAGVVFTGFWWWMYSQMQPPGMHEGKLGENTSTIGRRHHTKWHRL